MPFTEMRNSGAWISWMLEMDIHLEITNGAGQMPLEKLKKDSGVDII